MLKDRQGKPRIHHLEIENFDCQLEEVGKPIIFELKKIPLKVSKMFQNKDADCNIFATINDKAGSKNDFFTCQILCPPDGKPKPSLIIHCIQKRLNKRKYKLEIGWMVVGNYIDLIFKPSSFNVNSQLNILKNDFDFSKLSPAKCDSGCGYLARSSVYRGQHSQISCAVSLRGSGLGV